jgi:hypothetical protein
MGNLTSRLSRGHSRPLGKCPPDSREDSNFFRSGNFFEFFDMFPKQSRFGERINGKSRRMEVSIVDSQKKLPAIRVSEYNLSLRPRLTDGPNFFSLAEFCAYLILVLVLLVPYCWTKLFSYLLPAMPFTWVESGISCWSGLPILTIKTRDPLHVAENIKHLDNQPDSVTLLTQVCKVVADVKATISPQAVQ